MVISLGSVPPYRRCFPFKISNESQHNPFSSPRTIPTELMKALPWSSWRMISRRTRSTSFTPPHSAKRSVGSNIPRPGCREEGVLLGGSLKEGHALSVAQKHRLLFGALRGDHKYIFADVFIAPKPTTTKNPGHSPKFLLTIFLHSTSSNCRFFRDVFHNSSISLFHPTPMEMG